MTISPIVACSDSSSTNDSTQPSASESESATATDTSLASDTGDASTESDTESALPTESATDSTSSEDSQTGSNTDSESASETESETVAEALEGVPVFSNGAYTAKVIKADIANSFDKEIYTQIRNILKTKLGKTPSFASDFVPVNGEKYDGPAIIVGETNYTESINAYKTLKSGQASATLVGNKYIIAFTSAESATALLEKFTTLLNKKVSNGEMLIDSSWNIKISSSENTSFSESGLINTADLPQYDGSALTGGYDGGQGSKVYIKTNATKAKFDAFCSNLVKAGFKFYTSNTYGNNNFATYATKTQIVHVMFFGNISEIRIAVDKRGEGTAGFALPGLSSENKYTEKTTPNMTLVEIDNTGWAGGLCIIYRLSDGRFFVIDAGIGARTDARSSSRWIYNTLKKHATDPDNIVIAGWLITHIHSDHIGGLVDMARGYRYNNSSTKIYDIQDYKNKMTVEKLIYNQPSDAILSKSGQSGRKGWANEVINGFKIKEVIKAHPGQKIYIADATITILGSPDLLVEQGGTITSHNEYSVSAQIDFNGKILLALGDTEKLNNAKLAQIYTTKLKSHIVQTTHHGYGGTGAEDVYKYCDPDIVLFPICDWQDDENVNSKPVNDFLLRGPREREVYYAGHGNRTFDENWKAGAAYSVM